MELIPRIAYYLLGCGHVWDTINSILDYCHFMKIVALPHYFRP